MIQMLVTEGENRKWTVSERDGGNNRILLSSTSQGYDRMSRAEEIARRCAPTGKGEAVELVIRNRHGEQMKRELLDAGSAS